MTSLLTLSANSLLAEAEVRLQRRQLDAAIESFWGAEVLGADADRCAAGRWTAWMLRGEFASAWHEWDEVRRRGGSDPQRLWQGESLRGKRVIVRCLHGYGDAVQFLRYASAVSALAEEAIFEVPPQLLELAPCFQGVGRAMTWGLRAPKDKPRWDVQVEAMELPYLFRTELRELPIATSYIDLPQAKIRQVAQMMGSRGAPRVGVVWNAGAWNPSRSMSAKLLAPIVGVDGCEFWNLQAGPRREKGSASLSGRLRETPACHDGILSLAAIISQLDLVITVDALTAHLAGALGVPAWVMLQYAADWRWMTARCDSPWYPSLRLFRQQRQGDWASVISQIRAAMGGWLFERADSIYRYAS